MKKTIKPVLLLGIAVILGRLTGFIRESVLASLFGASSATDAYMLASTLPFVIVPAAASGLTTAVVSLLSEDADKPKVLRQKAGAILWSVLFFGTLAMFALFATSDWVARGLGPGLTETERVVVQRLVWLMIPTVPLLLGAGVEAALSWTLGDVVLPAVGQFLMNVLGVLVIVLGAKTLGINSVAIGVTVGATAQLLFLLYRVWPATPDLQQMIKQVKRLSPLLPSILVTVAAAGLNQVVFRAQGSHLNGGEMSYLGLALRVVQLPAVILGSTVITAVYPDLIQSARETERFAGSVARAFRLTLFTLGPAACGLALMSTEVVGVLFERGSFTGSDKIGTAAALVALAPGLIGQIAWELGNKILFVRGNKWVPAGLAVCATLLQVLVGLVIIPIMGYVGVAIAYSLSQIAIGCVLMIIVVRRHAQERQVELRVFLGKVAIASLALAPVVFCVKSILPVIGIGSSFLVRSSSTGFLIAIGAATYLSITAWWGVLEAREAVSRSMHLVRSVLSKLINHYHVGRAKM